MQKINPKTPVSKKNCMILIVDSGSTKTEWIFLDGERIENRVLTMGFNPNYSDMQTFEDMVVGIAEIYKTESNPSIITAPAAATNGIAY